MSNTNQNQALPNTSGPPPDYSSSAADPSRNPYAAHMMPTNTGGTPQPQGQNQLQVPQMDDNARRSMEDEERPLPEGWIRDWDASSRHHFYVNTRANPPRSIWHHPYDDPEYIASIPDTQQQPPAPVSASRPASAQPQTTPAGAPVGAGTDAKKKEEKRSFGGRIKDKLIGTKEEREAAKRRREQLEREAAQRYIMRRQQMMQSGYGQPGYGYSQGTHYGPPSMAYGRPQRRFGGAGGGMGMGLPLMGGLAGGMLLGSAMGGLYDGYDDYGGGDFDGGDMGNMGGDF